MLRSMFKNFKMCGVIYPLEKMWRYLLVNSNILCSHMGEKSLERDERKMISEWGLLEDKYHDPSSPPKGDHIQIYILDVTH